MGKEYGQTYVSALPGVGRHKRPLPLFFRRSKTTHSALIAMKTIDRPARFLIDNGLLFEVNRQVLHPLGLQLELTVAADGRRAGLELVDNRDSEAPIYFGPDQWAAGRSKYEEYMETAGRRNMQKRRRVGMVIQTGPNVPPLLTQDDGDG